MFAFINLYAVEAEMFRISNSPFRNDPNSELANGVSNPIQNMTYHYAQEVCGCHKVFFLRQFGVVIQCNS